MKNTNGAHNAKRATKPRTGPAATTGRNGTAGGTGPGPIDRFLAMSDYDKEAAFRECETITPDSGRPMTGAERRRWDAARRRGRGRPKIGKGTAVVSVTIERDLLAWADAYAKKMGLTRARLVGIALESMRDNIRRYRAVADEYDRKHPPTE